jgi:hypothetical protein
MIEHSNFRFADTELSAGFDCIANRPFTDQDQLRTPLFGRDDRRLTSPVRIGTVSQEACWRQCLAAGLKRLGWQQHRGRLRAGRARRAGRSSPGRRLTSFLAA